MIEELQSVTSRFYIYDDDVISQSQRFHQFRRKGEVEVEYDHVHTDMDGELSMLEALTQHPLRTMNPKEAKIFILLTPITELLAYGCHCWEDCTWFDEAFGALSEHSLFVKTSRSQSWHYCSKLSTFQQEICCLYVGDFPTLPGLLENVTVANDFDPFGCVSMELHNKLLKNCTCYSNFRTLYKG